MGLVRIYLCLLIITVCILGLSGMSSLFHPYTQATALADTIEQLVTRRYQALFTSTAVCSYDGIGSYTVANTYF